MNSAAGVTVESSAAALPACHARAEKSASHSPSRNSPARGPMSCCITLAPSATPPDAKPAVEMVLMPLAGFELAVLPLAPWTQVPIELDTGPPGLHDSGSLSPRAPPLA